MTLSDDFLEQARRLSAGSPPPIDLRRAVSSAYYAVFHAIGEEFAGLFQSAQRPRALRVHEHHVVKAGANRLTSSSNPLAGRPCPLPLKELATTIIQLQEARHSADYDATRPFTPREVQLLALRAIIAVRMLRGQTVDADDREALLMELVLPYRKDR